MREETAQKMENKNVTGIGKSRRTIIRTDQSEKIQIHGIVDAIDMNPKNGSVKVTEFGEI
jgi:ATP-dependent helicase/DNAse subunit B